MDRCWILLDAFFHLLRWSCAFVFFCCWCGVSHWSLYPCPKDVSRMRHDESNFVSRMNPTWLWHMIFVGFSLLIFCREFLCLYSSKILACNFLFFFCSVFVWFWYQNDGGFIEWLWDCSLLFSLLEEFENNQYNFFFYKFGRIPQWSHLLMAFCLQGVVFYSSF